MQAAELAYPTCDESFWKKRDGQLEEVQTTIRREVDAIKKRKYSVFLWVTFSVLLITFFEFLGMLFEPVYPPMVNTVAYSSISIVVFAIVAILWVNHIKPEEHVHVMAKAFSKGSRSTLLSAVFNLKEVKAHDESQVKSKKPAQNHSTWVPLILFISIFISSGLVLSSIISLVSQQDWANNTVTQAFEGQPRTGFVFPVIPVAFIIVAAAVGFLIYEFLYARGNWRIPTAIAWGLAITTALSAIDVMLVLYVHQLYIWHDIIWYASTGQAVLDYFDLVSHVVVLTATILLLAVIWQHVLDLKNFYSCIVDDRATDVHKIVALLPKRVRLNSSHAIFFCTQLAGITLGRDQGAKSLAQISGSNEPAYHLDLELQATGIKFDQKKHATIRRSHGVTTKAWTCRFSSPGVQTLNIILNRVNDRDGDKLAMFFQRHVVTVDNFFTATWLPILAAFIPILTAFIAALWR